MTDRDQVGLASWRHPLLFVLFVCMWFWHHPYQGILHDATLYTAQALRYLYPENFAQDVFFLYGSQDDYTLFSPLYAKLIEYAGQGQAALLITLFGALLWCYAAWRFSAVWPQSYRLAFLFLLAVMPIKFGGYEIFAAAEAFAVPRLWANALTLLACALWIEKRFAWALVIWLMAGLMHPLMALAGGVFVFFFELRITLRWGLAVAAGLLLACCLALLNAPLFERLFQVMDPIWFEPVYQRTSLYMFPTAWSSKEYNTLIFHGVALLWAAWLVEDVRLKRIFQAACATGLIGWLVAVVGGDWLHSVLVLQVQPWRTVWLMYVIGWGAVAWLVLNLWPTARFAVLGLVAAWFLREYSGGLILLMVLLLYRQRASLSQTASRWLEWGFGIAIVMYMVWTALDASTAYVAVYPEDELSNFETLLIWREWLGQEDALLSIWGVLLAYGLWRGGKKSALLVFAVLIGFLVVVDGWDWRSSKLKDLESGVMWEKTPFNEHIPQSATVYWLDGAQPTWYLIGRSSYYSQQQSAGLLFSRQLTMEIYRRYLRVKFLGGQGAEFQLLKRKEAFFHSLDNSLLIEPATLEGLRHACMDPKLDYVVLPKRHPPWVKAAWFAPYFPKGMYLYDCEDLRKS